MKVEYWEGECGCGHDAHYVWRVAASMSGPEEFEYNCCEPDCLCGEPGVCTGCFSDFTGDCTCDEDEVDDR